MNGLAGVLISIAGTATTVATLLWVIRWNRKKNRFSPFTEKLLRSPGYTLGKEVDQLTDDMFPHLLLIACLPLIYILLFPNLSSSTSQIVFGAFFLGAFLLELKKLVTHFKRLIKLRLGLDGEVYTGQELNFLMRDGAWVYHDIPYQYGNIDHIVVSAGGVFVVETKAVRKPGNEEGKRQSTVVCKQGKLHFPHFVTDEPLRQAQRHADYVAKFFRDKTGQSVPVSPVVALPGWLVNNNSRNGPLVINPKRGAMLRALVRRPVIAPDRAAMLAKQIEAFARSVASGTDKTDPDAHKKYTFWLNRKPEEQKL